MHLVMILKKMKMILKKMGLQIVVVKILPIRVKMVLENQKMENLLMMKKKNLPRKLLLVDLKVVMEMLLAIEKICLRGIVHLLMKSFVKEKKNWRI